MSEQIPTWAMDVAETIYFRVTSSNGLTRDGIAELIAAVPQLNGDELAKACE